MIRGIHGMFFTDEAEEARAFLRDILGLDHVDTGDGWLVFDVPEAELGVHPTLGEGDEPAHQLSFWCDDIEATADELEAAGVELLSPVEDTGTASPRRSSSQAVYSSRCTSRATSSRDRFRRVRLALEFSIEGHPLGATPALPQRSRGRDATRPQPP